MFAVQKLTQVAPKVCRLATQQRTMSVISGPPRVRIPFAEKMVHGFLISAGVLAIPVWVLVNIKHYRGLE